MFAQAYRFLGSIKLAMPLLVAIATILIGATFYESEVGSAAVQQLIYKSPWFGALMFMLAVNLGVSAISRYPWRGARKVGFALAHLGLIVIIAGSAAVIHLGTEGMMVLRTDGPALNQLRLEGDLLEVAHLGTEVNQTPVQINPDQTVTPKQFQELSLLKYRDHVMETTQFANTGTVPNPAVQLQLKSERMGQTATEWLATFPRSYQQTHLGPVQLELAQANSPTELEQLLTDPQDSDLGRWGQLKIEVDDQSTTLEVDPSLDQTLELDHNIKLSIQNLWPDFRLNAQSQPTTVSQELQNPVVALQIESSQGVERWYIFAQAGFEPIRSIVSGEATPETLDITYQVPPPQADRLFRVVVDAQNQLYYGVRSTQGFASGPLPLGEPIQTGWADFQITAADYLPQAQVQRQVGPTDRETGRPGLLVSIEGQEQWLPWGEPTELTASSTFAAFSPRLLSLPFAVGLEDFIVERNEGDESVAMWTSKIQLQDPQTGELEDRKVWMNHPTWYRGWKIAQASWNPGDLSQSTLQVKREPLWVTALTWTGALLVVSGIGTMFYGKQILRQWNQAVPVAITESPSVTEKETDESFPNVVQGPKKAPITP